MNMKFLVGIAGLASLGVIQLPIAQSASLVCEITIDSDDSVQFDRSRITVPSDCKEFTVTLTHSGHRDVKEMGHNWVLAKTEDWEGLAEDAMRAGPENDYILPGDERIIAYTDLIGGGESTEVVINIAELDHDTSYTFFCSFADHAQPMYGEFIVSDD